MVSPPSTSSFPAVRQLEGVGIDAFALQVEYPAALVSSIGGAVALRLPKRNQAAEPGKTTQLLEGEFPRGQGVPKAHTHGRPFTGCNREYDGVAECAVRSN